MRSIKEEIDDGIVRVQLQIKALAWLLTKRY
jgi:hypothetical protein